MITLVIPFVDGWEFISKTVKTAVLNSRHHFELIIIDNGSDENYEKQIKKLLRPHVHYQYIRNETNLGVIESFNQGLKYSSTDIICFIHSDVLLQESEWEKKIEHYFDDNPKLGLAGLLGGNGVAPDGGRMNVVSNMMGKEWGKCDCHDPVALHHGNLMESISPAIVLDGVGLFFRRQCMKDLQLKTTALDTSVRAIHHWYDRNLTLYAISLGWQVSVIGVGFDHYSGATANSSDKYHKAGEKWLSQHPDWQEKYKDYPIDQAIYEVGNTQFKEEWAGRLTAMVDGDFTIRWNA